jgi:hypothetical protein
MYRKLAGGLLILHGLGHTLAGMRATEGAPFWSMTAAWCLALIGFTTAGCSLLGLHGLPGTWRRYATAGVAGSLVLLLAWGGPLAVPGLVIDALVLVSLLATRSVGGVIGGGGVDPAGLASLDRLVIAALALLALMVLARPVTLRWGSSPAELRAALPGDEPDLAATYQIQHAVTIHATPARIWPWLVQLGEDRAGFYSYDALERLAGLHVRNADRVHPEWQSLAVGDTVFATHVGWLGQRRRFGWQVGLVRPDTVLVLERWGSFVLRPIDSVSTRLIVRTRGGGPDQPGSIAAAPLGFLVFEPIHFLMERKMLLTIKRRAESGA